MDTMYLVVGYLRIHARRLGRAIFRNDVGALSLEWIVIAVLLVAAAVWAGAFIKSTVEADAKKIQSP